VTPPVVLLVVGLLLAILTYGAPHAIGVILLIVGGVWLVATLLPPSRR